jgi:CheY-like chemotaxis protein
MLILLVEDSEEVSCIALEYLSELGHQPVAVSDAERALAQLTAKTFDAVLTDVTLPGMSGIDLARQLQKSHPHLPVILSSGYGASTIEALLGTELKTVLLLPKPYDFPALESTLAKAAAIARRP